MSYQLLNKETKVKALLDGIENSDAGLQVAIASIRTDQEKDGRLKFFKKADAYLVPYDPMVRSHLFRVRGSRLRYLSPRLGMVMVHPRNRLSFQKVGEQESTFGIIPRRNITS